MNFFDFWRWLDREHEWAGNGEHLEEFRKSFKKCWEAAYKAGVMDSSKIALEEDGCSGEDSWGGMCDAPEAISESIKKLA